MRWWGLCPVQLQPFPPFRSLNYEPHHNSQAASFDHHHYPVSTRHQHPLIQISKLNYKWCNPHISDTPHHHYHHRQHPAGASFTVTVARAWRSAVVIITAQSRASHHTTCTASSLAFFFFFFLFSFVGESNNEACGGVLPFVGGSRIHDKDSCPFCSQRGHLRRLSSFSLPFPFCPSPDNIEKKVKFNCLIW